MWKQRLKHAAARAAEIAGLWSYLEGKHRQSWTIVCYHRVLPAAERAAYFCPDLAVTPEALAAHCEVYRKHFEVLTVSAALDRFSQGEYGRRPLLSLTFDDGYADNFLFAAPVLERFGLNASFYAIAGLVNTTVLPWYDTVARGVIARQMSALPQHFRDQISVQPMRAPALARFVVEKLKRVPDQLRREVAELVGSTTSDDAPHDTDFIMTSVQLRALASQGHEIGAHSMTHPILTMLAPEALEVEIAEAGKLLNTLTDAPVKTYCYPNGDLDSAIVAATRAAGYRAGLSTRQGINYPCQDPFSLQRIFVRQDSLQAPSGTVSPALLRAELAIAHRFRGRY